MQTNHRVITDQVIKLEVANDDDNVDVERTFRSDIMIIRNSDDTLI